MSRTDELLAKKKAIDEELQAALKDERKAELALIKEKIKLFGFTTTDFKGVLKTRAKRGEAKAAPTKPAAKKKATA